MPFAHLRSPSLTFAHQVNIAKPLWMRPPKEVTDEEYAEFYKTTFKQYDTPAGHVHFSLEGQVEFRAMLFLPSSVPWELSQVRPSAPLPHWPHMKKQTALGCLNLS